MLLKDFDKKKLLKLKQLFVIQVSECVNKKKEKEKAACESSIEQQQKFFVVAKLLAF